MPSDSDPTGTPGVRSQPPPETLLRIINPTVRALLGTPAGRLLPSWMAVLIFTGRHSGTRYRVPIGIHDVQDIPTVFTDRPWRLNFREGAPVTVVQGGQQRHGNGVLVEGRENVGVALLDALQRTSRPSNLGLKVVKGHEPTVADLAALGSSMIQIQYDTEQARGETVHLRHR